MNNYEQELIIKNMQLKIFPYILSRVGGWAINQIAQLRFVNMEDVNVLLQKEKEIEIQFQKVVLSFQDTFQKTKNYKLRAFLSNAQKDFKKQKFSFVKKIKNQFSSDEDIQFVKTLLEEVNIYQNQIEDIKNAKLELENLFEKDRTRQYEFLQIFSGNENLQKGILQSSQSLFQRNKKYHARVLNDFRKKERQTARTLAQYFYRVAAKTSPFSFFTTLDILFKNNKEQFISNPSEESSFIQMNNLILSDFRKILLRNFSFYKKMKLQLNPSLRQDETELVFIKNEKNIESLQRIDRSEVFNLILGIVENKDLSFEQIIAQMILQVDAEEEDLIAYLSDVIGFGFLVWNWEMSGLTLDWEIHFNQWLINFDDFQDKEKWIELTTELITVKKEYANSNIESRLLLQNKTKQLLEEVGIEDMPAELIFFEDVKRTHSFTMTESEITPIIASADMILRGMESLVVDDMSNKISICWKEHFDENDSITLIDFYEKFYQKKSGKNKSDSSEIKDRKEFLKKELKKIGNLKDQVLDFSTAKLQKFFPSTSSKKLATTQYAGLFQFYKNKNAKHLSAVINGVAPGFGKLFGRFLPLFNKDITIELQEWNKGLKGGQCWIENTDASFYNANLHPSLLDFELEMPNGQNQNDKEKRIPINRIKLVWSGEKQSPILIDTKTKLEVTMFDFGFEHPSNRSPMFQLLKGFNYPNGTYRTFLEMVNAVFVVLNMEEEIKIFPRVVIDDRLVLQRKFWETTALFFPKKEKQDSALDYFYKIQKWRLEKDWSKQFFIRVIPSLDLDREKFNKDFFKPQFIDIESPLAIVLLHRVLEVENAILKIEEVLPQFENIQESEFVREEVIQWKVIN